MMTTGNGSGVTPSRGEMKRGGTIAMSTEIAYRIERLRTEAEHQRLAAGTRRGLRRTIGRALIDAGRSLQGLNARETADPGRQPMTGHA